MSNLKFTKKFANMLVKPKINDIYGYFSLGCLFKIELNFEHARLKTLKFKMLFTIKGNKLCIETCV